MPAMEFAPPSGAKMWTRLRAVLNAVMNTKNQNENRDPR